MDKMPEQMPQPQQENEKVISPELADTIARLKEAGYLDTSFEGKEVHELGMRALSKEDAIAEYEKGGGWPEVMSTLKHDMPYITPKAEKLEVMIMAFKKRIESDDALTEMDALGVRPLTFEELVQYGVVYPSHQKQKTLVALGSKYKQYITTYISCLRVFGDARFLDVLPRDGEWDSMSAFPVVRK